MLGSLVGVSLSFFLGRYVAREFAGRRKRALKRMDQWFDSNGVGFIIALRLVLFANPALNYAAGLTNVTFRDYFMGSFVGLLPAVFLFSYAFDIVIRAETLIKGMTHPAVAAVVVLRLCGILSFFALTRKHARQDDSSTEVSDEKNSFQAESEETTVL
jgi:uncharacterized membrane protein YdjX (TVP38/TMEM64 family)